MEHYDVMRLGLILSVQAEIEGMKSENEDCRVRGESMAFNNDMFQSKAQELQNLAYVPNEQL